MEYLLVAQLSLAFVFAISGTLKMTAAGREALLQTVRSVPPLSRYARFVIYLLPLAELVLAAMLLSAGTLIRRDLPLALATLTTALLLFFVAYALSTDLSVPCRCFGSRSEATVSWLHVIRNAALFMIAAFSWLVVANSEDGPAARPTEYLIQGLPAILIALIVVFFDDVVALWASK
jgi:hypothetical protein